MRKAFRSILFSFACLIVGSNANAAARIKDNLTFFKLPNGISVFIYNRPAAPLFTGMIFVDAGASDEQVGATGLAHLLEHMAFKGTPWIGTRDWQAEKPLLAEIEKTGLALNTERQKTSSDPKRIEELTQKMADLQKQEAQYIVPNEFDQIVTREGGQEVNATTSIDYTNYFVTLPANKLELWAMLESQRMLYPAWREFYLERDVVAEERRMRTEDSPMGKQYEEFISMAFKAHPYRNPVIGWMSDIYNLTITKIDNFYRSWYVPENMVILLVGDVTADKARPVLDKYFGTMEAKASPQKVTTVEPPQAGERRVTVQFDAQPQILMGWHKPTFPDKDMYVVEVLQYLLTRTGRTSRLYERLVKQDNICQEVDAWTGPGDKYPNLLMISMVPRSPHTNGDAEKAALEELERIKREPVPEEELQKIRNQIDADFLKELETNNGLARRLGQYYLASRDPDILDNMREEMKKVSAQDIMRVAQKYLVVQNQTVCELVTKPGAKGKSGRVSLPPSAQQTTTSLEHRDDRTTDSKNNSPKPAKTGTQTRSAR